MRGSTMISTRTIFLSSFLLINSCAHASIIESFKNYFNSVKERIHFAWYKKEYTDIQKILSNGYASAAIKDIHLEQTIKEKIRPYKRIVKQLLLEKRNRNHHASQLQEAQRVLHTKNPHTYPFYTDLMLFYQNKGKAIDECDFAIKNYEQQLAQSEPDYIQGLQLQQERVWQRREQIDTLAAYLWQEKYDNLVVVKALKDQLARAPEDYKEIKPSKEDVLKPKSGSASGNQADVTSNIGKSNWAQYILFPMVRQFNHHLAFHNFPSQNEDHHRIKEITVNTPKMNLAPVLLAGIPANSQALIQQRHNYKKLH